MARIRQIFYIMEYSNCWPVQLTKTMYLFIKFVYLKWRLSYLSLTYNHFVDLSYMADVCMGPMFWLVDNFTSTIGLLLVISVSGLTLSVVVIAYWIGIPHWWDKSPYICIILIILGHWLLLNISFNYYMACTVNPGCVPQRELISEAVSICKKCIAPKPPRAHHCSVCNQCILKMDHHCPWLNNCVGHRNHRYFFLYMVYMVVGVIFVIICGWDIAYAVIFFGQDADNEDLEGHSVKINKSGALIPVTGTVMLDPSYLEDHELEVPNQTRRRCIIYMALLNVGVFFALGCLSVWHASIITRNETSIETYINRAETLRMKNFGKIYVNPYDLGSKKNWLYFLGFFDQKDFWWKLLLPSIYEPFGDGLSWPTISNTDLCDKDRECVKCEISEETYLIFRENVFKKCNSRQHATV